MTEVEEEVLVTMCKYFIENSWIDRETENAFDTLVEKVCEPAPWDYSVNEQTLGQIRVYRILRFTRTCTNFVLQ